MTQPTTFIGMAWYRPEDYETILRIMVDRHALFDTYEEWLRGAEKGEQSLRMQGYNIVRAHIDPATFPNWCAANGHNIDAKARMAYANFIASQQARNSSH